MVAIYWLAFATGFLSLSQEILWTRLFSFTNYSLPQAFSFVLIMYLLGIAIGARIGRRWCKPYVNLWIVSGVVLVVSGFYDFAAPWIYASWAQTPWQVIVGGVLILSTALFKSIVFPIVHHLGTPAIDADVGQQISRVYVANILGATLGPLLSGMVLLYFFTTQQCFAIFAMVSVAVGLSCLIGLVNYSLLFTQALVALLVGTVLFAKPASLLIAKVAEQHAIRQIIEDPHGIVTLYTGEHHDDYVFGGNVYDGRTNLNPLQNSNGLERLFILPAILREKPAHVLMIGLSIGTWLKLLTGFPDVKSFDVVEINPGYLKAIKNYPEQASALADPRVHLFIDDGRRWLKAHPSKQYDLIVMNTTFYWRSYTSNLLSKEFLALLKAHMKPHAVLAYNTTYSPDALKTAATVFPHAYRYRNFAIAADYDWRVDLHQPSALQKIASITLNGKPLFSADHAFLIKQYVDEKIAPVTTLQTLSKNMLWRNLEVITDANLITEYKYGLGFH